MQPSSCKDVNTLLTVLLSQIQMILVDKLVGLYLYGSLVSGDFDHDISDIDLVAATSEHVDEKEFEALKKMHSDIADEYPKWNDRIEVQYISLLALQTCKTQKSKIVTISPGEPIHVARAGKDWLLNWFVVQEKGIVLYGPNQTSIIPYISRDEYVASLKSYAQYWRDWISKYNSQSSRGSCAFIVLTMCRMLFGYKHGEQVSKKQAALWAAKKFPQWSSLISHALSWRDTQWNSEQKSIGADISNVKKFVRFALDQIKTS